MKISKRRASTITLAAVIAICAIAGPKSADADVRLKRLLKTNGSRDRFDEMMTSGRGLSTFQASQDGKKVTVISRLTVAENTTVPEVRFFSNGGKPTSLIRRGVVTLKSGQTNEAKDVTQARLSSDGAALAVGILGTRKFVIDTATGLAEELIQEQFVPTGVFFEVVSMDFGASSENLYVTTRHSVVGTFPDLTRKNYCSLFRYSTTSKTSTLIYRDQCASNLEIDHITSNEAFALTYRDTGDWNYTLSRINLTNGEATPILSKSEGDPVGRWLSDDGETAIIHLDYLGEFREGKVNFRNRLVRVKSGKETILGCRDKKQRYSTELELPVVSQDGRFATFFAEDNSTEGVQGPENSEVGVLNLATGACAYLGESSRYLSNTESALAGDGSSVFFLQQRRKPGSDRVLESNLFSTSVKGIFKNGVRIK